MLEFKKVAMEDGTCLKSYLKNKEQYACEFTFGNNILWDVDGLLEYVLLEDVLLYRMKYPEKNVYCMPDFCGKMKEILDMLEADAKSCSKKYCITCLNSGMMEEMKEVYPCKYHFTFNADHSDYIYLTEKLATLSGRKLHKKKNHWNQFIKNHDFVYERISGENVEDCRKMKNEWYQKRLSELGEKESLFWESKAMDMALTNFDIFGFTGGLIRMNGDVAAFTLGEPVNARMFVVHFEKAFAEINGLYTAMNKLFAEKELLGKYEYVNREEDMGLPGLRQAKLSYYPEFLYQKWTAVPL